MVHLGCPIILLILLQLDNQPHKLLAFYLFWVKVVSFGYVKMGYDFLSILGREHVLIDQDIMIILIIFSLLKVVYDRHLRRIKL